MIDIYPNIGREILERAAPLLDVVGGTVETDPDLAAQWDVNESQRHIAYRALTDPVRHKTAGPGNRQASR